MPTYEFKCPKCAKIVEIERKLKDENPVLCCAENCGDIEMVQIISRTAFKLKGSGWAADGYTKGKIE